MSRTTRVIENREYRSAVFDVLSDDVRDHLLRFARQTLVAVTIGDPSPPPPRGRSFDEHAGVFVTLRLAGELRGCVGYPDAGKPLGEGVGDMTRAAATRDPRFAPVKASELDQIAIEISRLSEPEITGPESVIPGRHGVIVSCGASVGLLLPQVAVELGCSAEEFLVLACRKAGLPTFAWRDDQVVIRTFEAEVFGE